MSETSQSTTTPANEKHIGSCHCGKVRYEVTGKFDSGITCNCSICSRTGAILTFVPVEQFKLVSGEDQLTDYQFNKMRLHHFFCKTCGVRSFASGNGPDGKEMRAINMRCLENFDFEAVPTKQYNGKAS